MMSNLTDDELRISNLFKWVESGKFYSNLRYSRTILFYQGIGITVSLILLMSQIIINQNDIYCTQLHQGLLGDCSLRCHTEYSSQSQISWICSEQFKFCPCHSDQYFLSGIKLATSPSLHTVLKPAAFQFRIYYYNSWRFWIPRVDCLLNLQRTRFKFGYLLL